MTTKSEARAAAYTALAKEGTVKEFELSNHPEYVIMTDCGIDSLAVVAVAVELEETLGIEITDDDYENSKTVGDFVAMVEAKIVD